MTRYLYLVPFVLLCIAWARPGHDRKAVSLNPPVHLQTTWGSHKGGPVDTNAARAILDSPLVVTDGQGGTYTVTRFRFSYHQRSEYVDTTGKVISDFRLFSKEFYGTPFLDTLWRENIRPAIRSGEAFLIDNIVVKDAKGTKGLAPSLELDIR